MIRMLSAVLWQRAVPSGKRVVEVPLRAQREYMVRLTVETQLVMCMMIASWAVSGQSLEIVSPEARYQLGPSTPVNVDEGLYAHELIIAEPSGQPTGQIRWSDH